MKADAELRSDVAAEIAADPSVDAGRVAVAVHDGVVTLSGWVSSLPAKHAAEHAAQRVSGVRALAIDLEVDLPDPACRADEDIAAAARRALDWSVLIPREQVQATVEHGHVTLEGVVDMAFQRSAAERVIRELQGVRSVANHVRLSSPVDVTDLQRQVASALARQSGADAAQLSVRVEGRVVHLGGRVRSWAERDAAAHAAWSAQGVDEVVNDVVVSA